MNTIGINSLIGKLEKKLKNSPYLRKKGYLSAKIEELKQIRKEWQKIEKVDI